MRVDISKLIPAILLPLFVGALSGFITRDSVDLYTELIKPPLSPPAGVFPVVWTILYILMGIGSYLVWKTSQENDGKANTKALISYMLQLALNFIWPIVFFNGENYFLALVIIIILWFAVILMIDSFYQVNKVGAFLQIPYLVWVTFAAYLNMGVYLFN